MNEQVDRVHPVPLHGGMKLGRMSVIESLRFIVCQHLDRGASLESSWRGRALLQLRSLGLLLSASQRNSPSSRQHKSDPPQGLSPRWTVEPFIFTLLRHKGAFLLTSQD